MSHMPQLVRLTSMTPAALPSGSTHNYDPVDATTGRSFTLFDIVRQATNAAGSTITGLAARAGDFLILENLGTGVLTLAHESSSSTAANRFTLPNASNLAVAAGASVMLFYDTGTTRWHVNATGPILPSISDDGATVGFHSSAVTVTRNPDGVDGSTRHGRITIPSGIAGKAPFVIDTQRNDFAGTPDPILVMGYNALANGAQAQAGENLLSWNIEADYNDGSKRTMEAYINYKSSNGLLEIRPLFFQFNRVTNRITGAFICGNPLFIQDDLGNVSARFEPTLAIVKGEFRTESTTRLDDDTVGGTTVCSGTLYVDSTGGTGGIEILKSTKSARLRLAGGANELLQIGSAVGVTSVQIGPSALSGTAELVLTAAAAAVNGNATLGEATTRVHTINGGTTINGPSAGVPLTLVQSGSSRGIDLKKGTSTATFRIAGGSDDILQIGNQAGITTITLGPSAVSGTAEISLTAALATMGAALRVNGNVGFYNTAPIAKPAAAGSRGGNAALASLLTALANLGLITDSTTA